MTKTESNPWTRESILGAVDRLPPFPAVASRVLRLMSDPDSSAADLARAISRDQSLTARVLRAGNSSFYGFSQQVTSLPQAVVVLGLRKVRDLILFDSMPLGRGADGGMTDTQRTLWVHSVATALTSRLLALRAGADVDPEDAFLAGLFHDSGRLVLNHLAPEAFAEVFTHTIDGLDSVEAERTVFGLSHDELGYETLARWELPEAIRIAARDHHQDPAKTEPLTRAVQAANDFVHWMELRPPTLSEEDDATNATTNATRDATMDSTRDATRDTNTDTNTDDFALAPELDPASTAAIENCRPDRPGSAGALIGLTHAELGELEERLRVALERETRFFLTAA